MIPAPRNFDHEQPPTWRVRFNLPRVESAELQLAQYGDWLCVSLIEYEEGVALAHYHHYAPEVAAARHWHGDGS